MNERLRACQDEYLSALFERYLPWAQGTTDSRPNFRMFVQHSPKDYWHLWYPGGCYSNFTGIKRDYQLATEKKPEERTSYDRDLLTLCCRRPHVPIARRLLLPNEVLFESDSPDWRVQRNVGIRLLTACGTLGWSALLCWSGGKSLHVHLWYDASFDIGPKLAERLSDEVLINVPRIVRLTVFNAVLKVAWLSNVDIVDRCNVSYGTRRMVRALGAKHEKTGDYKSVLTDVLAEKPRTSVPEFPVELPPPAKLDVIGDRIRSALLEEAERISTSKMIPQIRKVRCVESAHRVQQGKRHNTLLRWATRQAFRCVPIDEARQEAVAWSKDVGGDPQEYLQVVEDAYRYAARRRG